MAKLLPAWAYCAEVLSPDDPALRGYLQSVPAPQAAAAAPLAPSTPPQKGETFLGWLKRHRARNRS